ncbi:MAG: hypothetical protein ACLFV7_04415 [Phycisphaerae bacterium]
MKERNARRLMVTAVGAVLVAGVAVTLWAGSKDHTKHDEHHGDGKAQPALHLQTALERLETARQAVKDGKKEVALAHLDKAAKLVKTTHHAVRPPVTNTKCPIIGNKVEGKKVPAHLYRVHDDKGVGFCCGGCPDKWDKLSADAKAEKLASVTPSDSPEVVNTKCPIMGSKLDRDNVPAKLTRQFKGKTVGFCCGGCPAAWDKLSTDARSKKLDAVTPADNVLQFVAPQDTQCDARKTVKTDTQCDTKSDKSLKSVTEKAHDHAHGTKADDSCGTCGGK